MIARDVHARMQSEVIRMHQDPTVDAVDAVRGQEIDGCTVP